MTMLDRVNSFRNEYFNGLIREYTDKKAAPESHGMNRAIMAYLQTNDWNMSELTVEETKVFIKGRPSEEEEKDSKLICEQIVTFEEASQAYYEFQAGHVAASDLNAYATRDLSLG